MKEKIRGRLHPNYDILSFIHIQLKFQSVRYATGCILKKSKRNFISFLTRAGTWGVRKPPQAFRRHLKNGDEGAPLLCHTCSYIFSAHVKISEQGCSSSGHQVT